MRQDEIVKGYKINDDTYITLTNNELKNLRVTDEDNIEIVGFVASSEIDPIFYEKTYVISTPIFDTSRPQSKVEPCFFYIFTCVVSRSVL